MRSLWMLPLVPLLFGVGWGIDRPNVVVIMTDDQGFGDLASHGNPHVATPNLDRLAADGARFDQFFVQPVCAPTRAGLLTGRYSLRTGTHGVTRGRETMRSQETTMGEVFRAAGYRTGCFGKWHNGAHFPHDPNGQGFDEFLGFCGGHWNDYFDSLLQHNQSFVETEGFIIDVLTDAAMRFMGDDLTRKFFAYIPYNTPHSPWQVPQALWKKYSAMGLASEEEACAYAMVENIDQNVGRILEHLEELGLIDDTVVVFLTDNGANSPRFNAGMRGRRTSVHEGGVRVPLFIHWPRGIDTGLRIDEIVSHIDLLPTLADLAGLDMEVTPTRPLDGISVARLLQGKARDWDERLLFAHWQGDSPPAQYPGSVRSTRYRALCDKKRGGGTGASGGSWELYDMVADPGEETNLAEQQGAILAEMRSAYEDWWPEVTRRGFAPIPAPLGHLEAPILRLPGHEALLQPAHGEGIAYHGRSGLSNDWVSQWSSEKSYPLWPIRVVRSGDYGVAIHYGCPVDAVGTQFEIRVGGQVLAGEIREPHDPEEIPPRDLVGEKQAGTKSWKRLPLGVVTLPEGVTNLSIHALNKPGEWVMDVKTVELSPRGIFE